MNLIQTVVQCLYPSLCRECNKTIPADDIFCRTCFATIRPMPSRIFPVTPTLPLKVYAISDYVAPIRKLVIKKFHGDVLASKQLARLMMAFTPLGSMRVDYLIPVPLHWSRYASRGFNQAYEIAAMISKQTKIPVLKLVRRGRKTTFQWKLSGQQRQENVKNAFQLSLRYMLTGTDFLRGKHIVLIDDLCTTGATLIQVAKVIAPYRPASISACVACRAT